MKRLLPFCILLVAAAVTAQVYLPHRRSAFRTVAAPAGDYLTPDDISGLFRWDDPLNFSAAGGNWTNKSPAAYENLYIDGGEKEASAKNGYTAVYFNADGSSGARGQSAVTYSNIAYLLVAKLDGTQDQYDVLLGMKQATADIEMANTTNVAVDVAYSFYGSATPSDWFVYGLRRVGTTLVTYYNGASIATNTITASSWSATYGYGVFVYAHTAASETKGWVLEGVCWTNTVTHADLLSVMQGLMDKYDIP